MNERIYPLIVWIYYNGKKHLFTKINVMNVNDRNTRIGVCIAKAIKELKFEVPIEVTLLSQSASTPSAIEVNRVAGVNIHTLTEESAVFILSKNGQFLAMSQENIRIHFVQEFSDFREKHRYAISEKRSVVAEKVKRCDDVYKALDF